MILAGALVLVVIVALAQWFMPQVTTPAAPTTTTTQTAPAKPDPPALGDKSIAVLPFANLSPDKEDAFFADGLTEEILNALAQIRGIRVISRTSSFAFKGRQTPLPEIAKQLAVRHVLEGSVRRDGKNVRVTAQLIDVQSDAHMWSQTFERKTEDVFVVQDEITRAIANALDVELEFSSDPGGAPTESIEAYRSFLEGRELFRLRRGRQDIVNSIALYKRAIALDAKFAEAYSALAQSYNALITRGTLELKTLGPLVEEAAATAIKLKPTLAQPYAALSTLKRFQLDWEGALTTASKASTLDHSDSLTLLNLGFLQLTAGYVEQSSHTLDEALRSDPLYAYIQVGVMVAAFARADDSTCVRVATRVVQSGADFAVSGEGFLAYYARSEGNSANAEKHFRGWVDKSPAWPSSIVEPVIAALKSSTAVQSAVKAINKERARDPSLAPIPLLIVGAQDDLVDAVSSELSRGNTARVAIYVPYLWRFVTTNKEMSPRHKALMRDVGLVDYWKKHGWPDRCHPKGKDDFECS